MKKLGIYANPVGFGRIYYEEKFLLSEKEGGELNKRLRKIPMDTRFEGKDIPKVILPENLPGNPIEKSGFDVSSIYHPAVNKWEVTYLFSPEDETRRELTLYPKLELILDSSDEGHVLSVSPIIKMFLQLADREGEHDLIDFGAKYQIIDLVNIYSKRNGNEFIVNTSAPIDDGWNFAPVSSVKDVCSIIDNVTSQLSVNDLGALLALRDTDEYRKKTCYSEWDRYTNEFVEFAMEGEYQRKKMELINRIKKSTKSK